jgi:glycosyltransferase involved in cell wall biosynthesis
MRVLTGIDLPYTASCGSIVLCEDLYGLREGGGREVRFLALAGAPGRALPACVRALEVEKQSEPDRFGAYVDHLTAVVEEEVVGFRPEVLHVQHLTFGLAAAFVARDWGVPRLAICHGTDILEARRSPLHREIVCRVLERCDASVFPTRRMLAEASDLLGRSPRGARVVPWGIPRRCARGARRRARGPTDAPLRVLYAGRATENKAPDLLVRALALAEGVVATFVVPQGAVERVESWAAEMGVRPRVEVVAWLAREDLWKRFDDQHCLVVPTRSVEAFCLVAVEAMTRGLPVVYSASSGLPEVIADAGLGFQAGDAAALATALQRFRTEPGLLERSSARAIERGARFLLSSTRAGLRLASIEIGAARRRGRRISRGDSW